MFTVALLFCSRIPGLYQARWINAGLTNVVAKMTRKEPSNEGGGARGLKHGIAIKTKVKKLHEEVSGESTKVSHGRRTIVRKGQSKQ